MHLAYGKLLTLNTYKSLFLAWLSEYPWQIWIAWALPVPEAPFSHYQVGWLLFSHSVMFDSLWPHGLYHAMLLCPSPSPGVCSSSCPLSQWWHPTISSSVIPFSSCLQSFPASGSFPTSWLSTSGGQSIGASALASVLPVNIQSWLPLKLTGLISSLCKGLSRVFSSTTVQRHQFFGVQPFLLSSFHIHTWLQKPQLWLYRSL